jgi:hypothetical protein
MTQSLSFQFTTFSFTASATQGAWQAAKSACQLASRVAFFPPAGFLLRGSAELLSLGMTVTAVATAVDALSKVIIGPKYGGEALPMAAFATAFIYLLI